MNRWGRRRCCSNRLTPCRRLVEEVVEVRLDEKTYWSDKEGRYRYIYICTYSIYIYVYIYIYIYTCIYTYLNAIDPNSYPSPSCPLCKSHDHTTQHLFSCSSIYTTLTPRDLWDEPMGTAALLQQWT